MEQSSINFHPNLCSGSKRLLYFFSREFLPRGGKFWITERQEDTNSWRKCPVLRLLVANYHSSTRVTIAEQFTMPLFLHVSRKEEHSSSEPLPQGIPPFPRFVEPNIYPDPEIYPVRINFLPATRTMFFHSWRGEGRKWRDDRCRGPILIGYLFEIFDRIFRYFVDFLSFRFQELDENRRFFGFTLFFKWSEYSVNESAFQSIISKNRRYLLFVAIVNWIGV